MEFNATVALTFSIYINKICIWVLWSVEEKNTKKKKKNKWCTTKPSWYSALNLMISLLSPNFPDALLLLHFTDELEEIIFLKSIHLKTVSRMIGLQTLSVILRIFISLNSHIIVSLMCIVEAEATISDLNIIFVARSTLFLCCEQEKEKFP